MQCLLSDAPFIQISQQFFMLIRVQTFNELIPCEVRDLLIGHGKSRITDRIDELQRGNERIVFQCTPEDPKLHGVIIHDVDADVSSTASFLGFVHDVLGSGFGTVAVGPLFQLTGCSSAEPENLLPIRFKEEHDPGDGIVLSFPGISEACPVHMDMQTAGCRFMGEIPEIQGLIHHFSPWHPVLMVMKGHGVGDEFEAVFQTAVLFDVEMFLFAIGRITDRTGMVMIVSAFIDLQLHTEVTGIITVEDGLRFVAVVQDSAFRGVFLLIAVAAVEGNEIIGEGVAVLDDLTAVGED